MCYMEGTLLSPTGKDVRGPTALGLPYAVLCAADDDETAPHTTGSPHCHNGEECVQCTSLLCGEPAQKVRLSPHVMKWVCF